MSCLGKTAASLLLSSLAALSSASCGDDGSASGRGSVGFSTWGEEYIELGLPQSEFADGYEVVFDRFLVLIGNIELADAEGQVAARHEGFFLVDHVEPGVKDLVRFDGLEAGAYERVSFETSPAARGAITLVGGTTDADAELMASGGYHVYAEGTLSGGGSSKRFAWGFGVPTKLDECEAELDGKLQRGALVPAGGSDSIELTIHGDHLFYDDLQASDAVLRGGALAQADADDDGTITLEELAAVRLVDLPADQYGVGGVSGVDELEGFVRFLSRTLGHFRGEGECIVRAPNG